MEKDKETIKMLLRKVMQLQEENKKLKEIQNKKSKNPELGFC